MSTLAGGVAAYTVLLTLLLACGEHLSRPAALPAALSAHRVVPAPSAVAAAVVAIEGLLGVAGVVALLRDDGARLLAAVLAGSAVLFAGYAGYALRVRSTGRSVPCGCSRAEVPMSGWVAARAGALAGLALAGAALSGAVLPLGRGGSPLAIVLLAAATFTALLAHLPIAMHDPQRPVRAGQGGVPG